MLFCKMRRKLCGAEVCCGVQKWDMLFHIKSCKNKTGKQQKTIAMMPGFAVAQAKRMLSAGDKSDLTDCLTNMCAKDIRLVGLLEKLALIFDNDHFNPLMHCGNLVDNIYYHE